MRRISSFSMNCLHQHLRMTLFQMQLNYMMQAGVKEWWKHRQEGFHIHQVDTEPGFPVNYVGRGDWCAGGREDRVLSREWRNTHSMSEQSRSQGFLFQAVLVANWWPSEESVLLSTGLIGLNQRCGNKQEVSTRWMGHCQVQKYQRFIYFYFPLTH